MKYQIFDWSGNLVIPQLEFDSFEDGWEYIQGELTEELGLTDEDYQEYEVLAIYPQINKQERFL